LIEVSGHKQLAAEASNTHRLTRRGIRVPLYAPSAEVLVDYAGLHDQLADGRTQRLGTAVPVVEVEKAEANVVPGLKKVLAGAISYHGIRHGAHARSLVTEEFSQSTELGFAGLVAIPTAFESATLEILHKLAILVEGLRDGRTAGRYTPSDLETGQKWFVNVVARLGKIGSRLLLRLTGLEREQDQ
jgi:hypothetical protein